MISWTSDKTRIQQGTLNSAKIHALSLSLAATQSHDWFFFFFLIAMLQRDNITMIQKHKTESKTEATSLLEAVRGSRSLLVEILNGWCKAGDGVREEVQLPLKERIKHASIHHCLH